MAALKARLGNKAPTASAWPARLAAAMLFAASLAAAQTSGAEVEALLAQAVALEHGEGVARDAVAAAKLYCRAARLGNPQAQFALGWMYANARGMERDDAKAAALFSLAAAQGHLQAQNMLRLVGSAGEPPECLKERKLANRTPAAPEQGPPTRQAPDVQAIVDAKEHAEPLPGPPKLVGLVRKLAAEYRVDARLALAVMRVESNFNVYARSPKNAQGLMQLIPQTAQRFQVRDAFDPAQNIRGGLAYLRWLLAYFRGDVALVAAAYNAGEGTVDKYGGVPPYPETRAYVDAILRLFRRRHHPYDQSIAAPSLAFCAGEETQQGRRC